jgi:hypothetical protein
VFQQIRALTAFVAAYTVCVAPVLVKNWSVSGSPTIQGYGGLNVYIGNSPLHDGRATFRLGAGWDALNSEAPRAGISDPVAQDRYYLSKAFSVCSRRNRCGSFRPRNHATATPITSSPVSRRSFARFRPSGSRFRWHASAFWPS